jgi:manganese/zinc/iron transport system permease protein
MLTYNTAVVAAGLAAVGFAAGVVGTLGVLQRRALAGDAAAHATLVGVALAFALTGRRDLATLLGGAFIAAVVALGMLVLIRRLTRTRDDAATAIVLGVSFGAGIALVAGMAARGLPGSGGLEQFLLGHTAALTRGDAILLAAASLASVIVIGLGFKETTLVVFDRAFAAAAGWPVTAIDYLLVMLVAVMVVVGLPAAGAVLVTALVVIPPVAARQWTERVGTMMLVAGCIGLVAAVGGVVASAAVPRLATGPVIVLVAALAFAVSMLAAPRRGWFARAMRQRAAERRWGQTRLLAAAGRRAPAGAVGLTREELLAAVAADGGGRPLADAWEALVRERALVPAGRADAAACAWRLSAEGEQRAAECRRRLDAWDAVLAHAPEDARAFLTIDLPAPEDVIDAARLAVMRAAAAREPGRPS